MFSSIFNLDWNVAGISHLNVWFILIQRADPQLSLSTVVDEALLSPWEGGWGVRVRDLSCQEVLEGMYFSKCRNTSHVSCILSFFFFFHLHFFSFWKKEINTSVSVS